jgi:hypothetical protein
MLVELDIFSGRPNPRWQLEEPAVRRLCELHGRLDPATDSPAEPPGLGYRGFVYTIDESAWRALKGFVVGPDRALADPDRDIERLLAEHLPAEYRELRARIDAELQRGR